MTKRAQEIEEQYEWLEKNFPEVGKQIIVTSLGHGESLEGAARTNLERIKQIAPSLADQNQDDFLRDHMQFMAKSSGKLSATQGKADDIPLQYIQIPTALSLATMTQKYPALSDIIEHHAPLLEAYSLSQERIHAVDGLLNADKYEKDSNGNDTPLSVIKKEAVGEIYSTLSLCAYQAEHGKIDGLEDFFSDMRHFQRTTTDLNHSLTDEASLKAEGWAQNHSADLKNMTPRQMLEKSHELAKDLPYPTLEDTQTLTSGSPQEIEKNEWWQTQKPHPEPQAQEPLSPSSGISIPNFASFDAPQPMTEQQPAMAPERKPTPSSFGM